MDGARVVDERLDAAPGEPPPQRVAVAGADDVEVVGVQEPGRDVLALEAERVVAGRDLAAAGVPRLEPRRSASVSYTHLRAHET